MPRSLRAQLEGAVQRGQRAVGLGDQRAVDRLRDVPAVERGGQAGGVVAGPRVEEVTLGLGVESDAERPLEFPVHLPELAEHEDAVVAVGQGTVLRVGRAVEADLGPVRQGDVRERHVRVVQDAVERRCRRRDEAGLRQELLLGRRQRVGPLPLEVEQEEAVRGEARLGRQELLDGPGRQRQHLRRQPRRSARRTRSRAAAPPGGHRAWRRRECPRRSAYRRTRRSG